MPGPHHRARTDIESQDPWEERLVPARLNHVPANSVAGSLRDLLTKVENVFVRGWATMAIRASLGIIHLDVGHRVTMAALQSSVGAHPADTFATDWAALTVIGAPAVSATFPNEASAYKVARSNGECLVARTIRPASMDIQEPLVRGTARAKSRGRSSTPSARASSGCSGDTATTDPRVSRRGRDPRREARAQSIEPRRRSTMPRGSSRRQASESSGGFPAHRDHYSVAAPGPGPHTGPCEATSLSCKLWTTGFAQQSASQDRRSDQEMSTSPRPSALMHAGASTRPGSVAAKPRVSDATANPPSVNGSSCSSAAPPGPGCRSH